MSQKPSYTYVFRHIVLDDARPPYQGTVYVITSDTPLDGPTLDERLQNLSHRPREENMFIAIETGSDVKLDTWELAIESCFPTGPDPERWQPTCWGGWWSDNQWEPLFWDGSKRSPE